MQNKQRGRRHTLGVRYRTLAVLLSASMALPSGAAGADCSQVLEKTQAEARAFQAEADRQGLKSALDASLEPALDLAKKSLVQSGGAHAKTLAELKDAKEKLQGWKERVSALTEFLVAVSACLRGGPPGCLSQLAGKVSEENRAYIQELAGEGAAASAQRVDKAASFLTDYTSRLNGAAEGSALAAVSCLDQRIQQLAPSGSGSADVAATPTAKGKAAPPADVKPKGGSAGGAILLIGGLVAVTGGALAYALKKNQGGQCGAGSAACRPPGASGAGADKCCPVGSPYYCVGDGKCYPSSVGTPAAGCPSQFYFCSTEY